MAHVQTLPPCFAVLAALLLSGCHADEEVINIAINTPRVWLTQMEQLAADVTAASWEDGQPPVETNFTIARTHSMLLEGYMVTASGQVADVASSITAFTAQDLIEGWTTPMLQFPFGWSPSEIYYNMPELGDTPLKLDACAVAGMLTANITSWDDEQLRELNPEAPLPNLPITLVYLNLSMPITQILTQYLSTQCPEKWTYGITDNLGDVVVAWGDDLMSSADVEGNWQAVNSTEGAISIGGSMPVGLYVAVYPAAMQYVALKNAADEFVVPSGDLNDTALAEMAAQVPSPGNTSQDWTFLYQTPPGVYPVLFWGLTTVPMDLSAEGLRGHYIRDTVGYLLTDEGQSLVGVTGEYKLPPQLMSTALAFWSSIKVSNEEVDTGIPTPTVQSPVPAPAPSNGGSWQQAAVRPLLALVAAALAVALA